MLNINVAASAGANAVNEDVVGHCAGAAWVLDGATGVGEQLMPFESDAVWFATRMSALVAEGLQDRPNLPTRDLLARAMEACRDQLHRNASRPPDAHELPSAAFAMVRQRGDAVEFCTLSDCRIAYRDEDGTARLFDGDAIRPIEARMIARAVDIRRRHPAIDPAAFRARLLPQLRKNRELMNQPGGYWILGTEPAAADHADLRTLSPKSRTDSLTDHPRIKAHDDICFVHCEYRKEG